jgi:hypothetical protein
LPLILPLNNFGSNLLDQVRRRLFEGFRKYQPNEDAADREDSVNYHDRNTIVFAESDDEIRKSYRYSSEHP